MELHICFGQKQRGDIMVREKKIIMKYLVEITVEGYGDRPYFKEVAKERLKELHLDVTSAHVTKGSASVEIKRSKILNCEEIQ